MKIFHYSHLKDQIGIREGSWKSSGKPGLGANLKLGTVYPEARNLSAVFCHLKPLPESWINNPYFKDIWLYFLNNIGHLLMEIEVDENRDQGIFVVDRGHMEGFLYIDKNGIPRKYRHSSRREAEKAYVESKIPLREYLRRSNELCYSLPEVIVTHDVPLESIRICEYQPLLEKDIRKKGPIIEKEIKRIAQYVPDLEQWWNKYLEREGGLEEDRTPLV